MTGFLSELKRRNVIRMAGLYLVGAWLLTQVSATVLPLFNAPIWLPRGVVIALAIGFIPAMIFAWIFELTPDGLKRDSEIPEEQSIAPQTAQKMNRLIVAMLILAVIYFGVDKFVLAPKREAMAIAAATDKVKAQTLADIKTSVNEKSIAVLPFVNMSSDNEQEYFSDGLSEEILNSLARIEGMQVVGRTSSFQFKGKNEDLRSIGEKLGVAAVLEGSVRRDGNRARITAQLIRANDGFHLWSETYDRDIKDTLAVQLDIAEKVASALNVLLDDTQRNKMRSAGVSNVDAFIAYQKGLKLYTDAHANPATSLFDGLRSANAEFDRATVLEPDFFEAHFAKADLYEHLLQDDNLSQAERMSAQHAALQALQLAADNSKDEQQRLLTLAERQMLSDDWHGLSSLVESALKAPGCNASNWLPVFVSAFGYGDEIENLGARASACDPLNSINFRTRITAALATGQALRALDVAKKARKAGNSNLVSDNATAIAHAILGQNAEAKRLLDEQTYDQQNEVYYIARVLLGHTLGLSSAEIQDMLRSVNTQTTKYNQWAVAHAVEAVFTGDREQANRFAAEMDARPAGPFLLAVYSTNCRCGAPFDLEYTPNFKARLAESGLRWPPPVVIAPPLPATVKIP